MSSPNSSGSRRLLYPPRRTCLSLAGIKARQHQICPTGKEVITIQTRTTHPEMQAGEGERTFIQRRESYEGGAVVMTAFCEGGTAFLEQHTFSSGSHVLLPLTSLEAIEHLEMFLPLAKAHVRFHQEEARRLREQLLANRSQPG